MSPVGLQVQTRKMICFLENIEFILFFIIFYFCVCCMYIYIMSSFRNFFMTWYFQNNKNAKDCCKTIREEKNRWISWFIYIQRNCEIRTNRSVEVTGGGRKKLGLRPWERERLKICDYHRPWQFQKWNLLWMTKREIIVSLQ
jgi:hypothetical protein